MLQEKIRSVGTMGPVDSRLLAAQAVSINRRNTMDFVLIS